MGLRKNPKQKKKGRGSQKQGYLGRREKEAGEAKGYKKRGES